MTTSKASMTECVRPNLDISISVISSGMIEKYFKSIAADVAAFKQLCMHITFALGVR